MNGKKTERKRMALLSHGNCDNTFANSDNSHNDNNIIIMMLMMASTMDGVLLIYILSIIAYIIRYLSVCVYIYITWSVLLLLSRWLSQPICLNSPIILANARLTSCNARCVLRLIVECRALNHINASCESFARNMHE